MNRVMLTKDEAQALVDAYSLRDIGDDNEENDLLRTHNPTLYSAYERLLKIADGQ